MKNVFIYCEGQTEESFVNAVLYPYFSNIDIYVTPIIHKTKRTPTKSYKGGVIDYKPIKDELRILCKNQNVFVTTMFDYYGMPSNTPAIDYTDTDLYNRIEYIEQAITNDIGCNNLSFNLLVHEFEGLLFSDTQAFSTIANDKAVEKLQAMRATAETPEHINNSVNTAPSKRIESVISDYTKVRQGIIVAKNIGINKMLSECKHFADWIDKIKSL
ncbi:MAG TPA: hypothetical protein DIW26_08000 [Ruminococcus sp.]|nr:hypothetical protein [Ruminococcus sp.]